MGPEITILSGASSGLRLPLAGVELTLGQAQSNTIRIEGMGVARSHCKIVRHGDVWQLQDLGSGSGTYVNGQSVSDHMLQDGDQIEIGDSVLLFQTEGTNLVREHGIRVTLLRASALVFLARSLANAIEGEHRTLIETQIGRIVAELLPLNGVTVLLGGSDRRLLAEALERSPSLGDVARHVCAEGSVSAGGMVAVPLYVRGKLEGMIAGELSTADQPLSGDYRDALTAVSTIAAAALESERELAALKVENAILVERLGIGRAGITGAGDAMRRLLELIDRVAGQNTTVLILGESGTGKELVAHEIHRRSSRRTRPFVAINCAALTASLLESELFGHEKGAFTGAVAQKQGRLEMASGGTVFLDEVGELALELQGKLLRVLQEREFERVGGTRTLALDVRLLAATNRDLAEDVRSGKFREDLYHRLNVVALRVPPLRERREDIPVLAKYFLEQSAARCGRQVAGFSREAEIALLQHSWPGNVRELENAIERAVVLGIGEQIGIEDLPEMLTNPRLDAEDNLPFEAQLEEAKRKSILRAWVETGGDYKRAAAQLGIHPNSLLRLVRKLGLRDRLSR